MIFFGRSIFWERAFFDPSESNSRPRGSRRLASTVASANARDPGFNDGEVLIGAVAENRQLHPGVPAAPPGNPPQFDLRSALLHTLGGRR
jgi:hypothetical protein